MNKQKLVNLINDPSNVSGKDIDSLESLVTEYPYCQAAHILLAGIHTKNKSLRAQDKLHLAAIYATDRSILRETVKKASSTFISEEPNAKELESTSKAVEETLIEETSKGTANAIMQDSQEESSTHDTKEKSTPPVTKVDATVDEVLPKEPIEIQSETKIQTIDYNESSEKPITAKELVVNTDTNDAAISLTLPDEESNSIYKELEQNLKAFKDRMRTDDEGKIPESNTEANYLKPTPADIKEKPIQKIVKKNVKARPKKASAASVSVKSKKATVKKTVSALPKSKPSKSTADAKSKTQAIKAKTKKKTISKVKPASPKKTTSRAIKKSNTDKKVNVKKKTPSKTASKKEVIKKVNAVSKKTAVTKKAAVTKKSSKQSVVKKPVVRKVAAKKPAIKKSSAKNLKGKKVEVKKKPQSRISDSENLKIINSLLKKNKQNVKSKAVRDQNQIIDKFIQDEPSISRVNMKGSFNMERQEDLAVNSVIKGDDLISENLALIMLDQGKKSKAIDIYKKLIWKYPQKKAYFAAQIEKIK